MQKHNATCQSDVWFFEMSNILEIDIINKRLTIKTSQILLKYTFPIIAPCENRFLGRNYFNIFFSLRFFFFFFLFCKWSFRNKYTGPVTNYQTNVKKIMNHLAVSINNFLPRNCHKVTINLWILQNVLQGSQLGAFFP